jgi:hypothetical protein
MNDERKSPKWWTVFEDNSNGFSAMRVGFLLTILLVMFNWTYICILKKDLVPIPESAVALMVGMGTVKTVQRFGEKPAEEPPTS